MKEWGIFLLFLLAGLGLLFGGIYYWLKEKHDAESVKIYRTSTIIGAVITAGALVVKFIL